MKVGDVGIITSDLDRDLVGKTCTIIQMDEYDPQDPFETLYEQEEDEFEWVDKILNFKEVEVVNRGSHYSAHTDVMKILRVPGVEEFIKKFGDDWNFSDDVDRPPFDGDVGEFIRHHVPVLGYPQNGDKCYLVGCYDDSHSSGRNICLLTRISDGKMFLMNERGFRYL